MRIVSRYITLNLNGEKVYVRTARASANELALMLNRTGRDGN